MLRIGYDRLWEIDKHYIRKEQLFFPKLEKIGRASIPQVMWGVDDEIRSEIKEIITLLSDPKENMTNTKQKIAANLIRVKDMVTKENNILLPILTEHMHAMEWIIIDAGSDEIGYFLEAPTNVWRPKDADQLTLEEANKTIKVGTVPFSAGSLTFKEVNAMLNTLPFDLTFVDAEGHVKYFTQGKERIFVRPLTALGRHVNMCHPPQSVNIVEEIVESFKNGTKDSEEFWIQSKDMFIHIRYFAVRDEDGTYLGVLEVSQDIKPLRDLEGEKRLV